MPTRMVEPDSELAAAGVHLYHSPISNCSQRVRLALAEKGVDWVDHVVDLYRYENLEPAFQALNPKGVVPVLVHDRTIVTESTDIVDYVDDVFDGPSLGRDAAAALSLAKDAAARVNAVQWCIKTLTFEKVFRQQGHMTADHLDDYRKRQTNPENVRFMEEFVAGFPSERIERCTRDANALLAYIEGLLGDGRAFLGGTSPSIADIDLIVSAERFYRLGVAEAGYQHVEAWRQRMHGRDSWARAVTAYPR